MPQNPKLQLVDMLAKFQEDSFVLSALHQMMMQVVVIFWGPYKYVGVVVWNMFCFSIYWEFHHPN